MWNFSLSVQLDIKRYLVEHEIRKSITTSSNGFFDDFPKISKHFPMISEDSPKVVQRPGKHFRAFSENVRSFPKMAEDFRGRTDDVLIIQ